MATYDFSALDSKFAEIVAMMPDRFDSHEFLLKLAQHNQHEYISALNAYKESGNTSPFQAVHGAIAQKLANHTELVRLLPEDKTSPDIWGNSQACAEWQKV